MALQKLRERVEYEPKDAVGLNGALDYQNSWGQWLHGVVTSYRQIDAHTAVFAGTITCCR